MGKNGRVLTVLVFSAAAMLLLCIVTPLAVRAAGMLPPLPWENACPWVVLTVSAVIMGLAIPVHGRGLHRSKRDPKKRRPWCWAISFLMNSVSCGLAAAALQVHLEHTPSFRDMLPSMLPGLAVMCAVSLLLVCFPDGKKLILCLAAVAAVALIVLQFFLKGTWSAVFGLVIALFYLMALWLTAGYEYRPVLRDVSFGSFGAAMVIAFVVLLILSDGEALESLDGLGGIGGGDTGFSETAAKRKQQNVL